MRLTDIHYRNISYFSSSLTLSNTICLKFLESRYLIVNTQHDSIIIHEKNILFFSNFSSSTCNTDKDKLVMCVIYIYKSVLRVVASTTRCYRFPIRYLYKIQCWRSTIKVQNIYSLYFFFIENFILQSILYTICNIQEFVRNSVYSGSVFCNKHEYWVYIYKVH